MQKANPSVAAVHALAGSLALLRNDNPAAKSAFERALTLDRQSLEALGGLIALDFKANNTAAAKAKIEARLKTDKSLDVLLLAARTYWAAQDFGSAETVLRQAIDADPSLLTSYAMLGQLYVAQKKLEQARVEFDNLASKQTKPVGALTMSGIILEAQGKRDLAKKKYEDALAVDSRAVIAANNLAWLYADAGENLDTALQLAKTATSVAPESHEIIDTLGWVYLKKQQANLAIPLFESCIEKAPGNASYHYHLGLAYLQTGDTKRGRAALERALTTGANAEATADIRRLLSQNPAQNTKG